jgi:hypothetical protein
LATATFSDIVDLHVSASDRRNGTVGMIVNHDKKVYFMIIHSKGKKVKRNKISNDKNKQLETDIPLVNVVVILA